jgi:hypothetical protein
MLVALSRCSIGKIEEPAERIAIQRLGMGRRGPWQRNAKSLQPTGQSWFRAQGVAMGRERCLSLSRGGVCLVGSWSWDRMHLLSHHTISI